MTHILTAEFAEAAQGTHVTRLTVREATSFNTHYIVLHIFIPKGFFKNLHYFLCYLCVLRVRVGVRVYILRCKG